MDQKPGDSSKSDLSTEIDRRRSGRIDDVSPNLVPLLRGEIPVIPEPLVIDPVIPSDDLAASKGILLGALIGSVIWAALIIAGVVFYLAETA